MTAGKYTVKNLGEIADYFETLASDQLAMASRHFSTKRDQRDRQVEARIWNEAAALVRQTSIEP